MATVPKETIYLNIANGAWTTIPVTIAACRRMVITEVPTDSGSAQTYAPQGLQYQRWDATTQTWGATQQAVPGEEIPVGDGMSVIGWNAQTMTGGTGQGLATQARAADTPIRIQSATATGTQVRAREWNRGFAITS